QIQRLVLQEKLLLLPPFRSWTSHLLNNSPHITSLWFSSQPTHDTSSLDSSKIILPTVHLPSLTHLELEDMDIPYQSLSSFLTRHASRITNLKLYASWGLYDLQTKSPLNPGWVQKDQQFDECMPMLEEVLITLVYLLWLMNRPLSGGFDHGTDSSNSSPLRTRFPRFSEVVLTTDGRHLGPGRFWLSLVDGALRAELKPIEGPPIPLVQVLSQPSPFDAIHQIHSNLR
ncbi:hypothetical protein BDN72DRAFT_835413, partial [Pluteus cervinus]